MLKEFKAFIMKGNIVDLAVAVIIGGAFGAIVTSLVDDIFQPIIASVFNAENIEKVVIHIGSASIGIGKFAGSVINFLIVAAILFMIIKAKEKAEALSGNGPEEEEPAADTVLLTEIRDLLKNK